MPEQKESPKVITITINDNRIDYHLPMDHLEAARILLLVAIDSLKYIEERENDD